MKPNGLSRVVLGARDPRRDMREHEIRPPVVRGQPVTRREVDAYRPFFRADAAAATSGATVGRRSVSMAGSPRKKRVRLCRLFRGAAPRSPPVPATSVRGRTYRSIMAHRARFVAVAGDRRFECLEFAQIIRPQPHLRGARVLLEVAHALRAGNRNDRRLPLRAPRPGQSGPESRRAARQRVEPPRPVPRYARPFSPAKRGLGFAEVVVVQFFDVDRSGEESAAERAIRHEADAHVRARPGRTSASTPTFPQRILALQRADRMHRMCPAQRVGTDFGEPEKANLAGRSRAPPSRRPFLRSAPWDRADADSRGRWCRSSVARAMHRQPSSRSRVTRLHRAASLRRMKSRTSSQ